MLDPQLRSHAHPKSYCCRPSIQTLDTVHVGCAEKAIEGNLLFDMLSMSAKRAIIDSMTPLHVTVGTDIITQGDTDATKFYVLEKGACDVYVKGADGITRRVHSYKAGRCRHLCTLAVF